MSPEHARLNEFTPAPFYSLNRLVGKSSTNQKRVTTQVCNCYVFVKLPALSGFAHDEPTLHHHPHRCSLRAQAFQDRPHSHAIRSPASRPITGLVIANQNSKALRSSTYVLMLMGLSFYKASVVLHARVFDTVRKFEPGTFPPSYWRQKIRFEKEQSGNGGEKSGN